MWDWLQKKQQIIVMEGYEGKLIAHIVLRLKLNHLSSFFHVLSSLTFTGVQLKKP